MTGRQVLLDAWTELTDTVGVPVGIETDTGQISLSAVKKFGALLEAALTQPAHSVTDCDAMNQPQPSSSAGEVLDNVMAESLAVAMKAKLARAREKGRGGWECPDECTVSDLWRMMVEHAHKPNLDMVDVANFAGMIWWRLERCPEERRGLRTLTLAAQQPAPSPEPAREQLEGLATEWEVKSNQLQNDYALGLSAAAAQLRAALAPAHVISPERDEAASQKGMREAAERIARSVVQQIKEGE